MESKEDRPVDEVVNIHEEDSTLYLFGSELYCGWCLESFTCPVRLKIHCCVEHLAVCSCGIQFPDKQSLCDHIVDSGCLLPPPFQWYHFLNLPIKSKLSDVHITDESENEEQIDSLDNEVTNEEESNKSFRGIDESIQKTSAETVPDKVKDRLVFWDSKYASTTSCTRSCPTCSRTFSVVSKYIHHRAICRAKRGSIQHTVDTGLRKYNYLINFCEPAPDGRWNCKLCKRSAAHRGDLYKHIRAKHTHILEKRGEFKYNYLINFCEPAPDGRWNCKLCKHSAAHRPNLYKHIRAKHCEVQKTNPGGSTELSLKASTVKYVRTPFKKHAEKSKAGNTRLFGCALCPFQSLKKSNCRHHIKEMHGKKAEKYICSNGHDNTLEKVEDCTTEDNKEFISTVYEPSTVNEVTLNNAPAGKPDGENVSLTSSQSCCDKHRSDDVQFLVSCFSSPVAGQPLSCQLCGDKFGELEEAAVHVYNTHMSAVQQWRDTRANTGETQALNENNVNDRPGGDQLSYQLEKLPSDADGDIPNPNNAACEQEMHLSISEPSSVKLEPEISDTYTGPSGVHSAEKEVKREFTLDECNLLASSLCRLFNCWNAEPKAETSDEKIADIHSTQSEGAVNVSSPAKKTTGSHLNSGKTSSSEVKSVMQLISRKCKYCHRLCSNRFNCQRHEAVCSSSMVLSSKRGVKRSRIRSKHIAVSQSTVSTSVRAVYASNIFYCAKCGFSDSDHLVVNEHSKQPHLNASDYRLYARAHAGHDFIGSMKVANGNYQCSLCGLHMNSRINVLSHLRSHSTPVQIGGMDTVKQESSSDGVKVECEEKHSGLTTASYARSCPKCSRSFSSTALYLRHRAVCRVIQDKKVTKHRPRQYHYFHGFFELTPGGRWQCKFCVQSTAHRSGMYRHIRKQHRKMLNAKDDPK